MNSPEKVESLIDEAFDDYIELRFFESMKKYKEIISKNPKNAKAWKGYHLALEALGKEDEAEVAIFRAIELDPDDDYIWRTLIDFLDKSDYWTDEAFLLFERALERFPENDYMPIRLASQLQSAGELEKAEQVLRKSLQTTPDDICQIEALVKILRSRGRDRTSEVDAYKKKLAEYGISIDE